MSWRIVLFTLAVVAGSSRSRSVRGQAAGSGKAAMPAPAARGWSPIEATTYEQRQAADPARTPAAEELFALPFSSAVAFAPPRFFAAGEAIAPEGEPWRIYARLVPRRPIHDDYLRQREASAGKGLALVDWCRKNHLDDCAEFEASCRMNEIDDFQKPEYAPFLQRWLPIRDRRQIDVSFPLPLEGEWFVLRDSTGHHRKKAFAAYAFDIVKKVDDKVFRNDGRQLADYYGFGQPILAQADGVVVSVDDATDDNPIGKLGGFEDANAIVIDYGGGVLADYAHLKKGSARVKPGARVVRGTPIGAVGNSGASGLPHLHFTFMDWAYDSIRGRFTGEVLRGSRWVAFEGQDLEMGTSVRNRASPAATSGH